jgi:hypothetical protein
VLSSVGTRSELHITVQRLVAWLRANGWASYDIHDFKALPLFAFLLRSQSIPYRLARVPAYTLSALFPVAFRRLLGIKPQIVASGMGQLAQGYCDLYRLTGEEEYLDEAERILSWLAQNHIKGYSGYCWGLPFDWQSVVKIPRDTPLVHSTVTCAQGFLSFFELTNDRDYLQVARSACDFIAQDVNARHRVDGGISLSYCPLDDSEVINVSADVAALFNCVGRLCDASELIDFASRLMKFVVDEQLPSGAWGYFSERDRVSRGCPLLIDNYHTAMVLGALVSLLSNETDVTRSAVLRKSFVRGLQFYVTDLFASEAMPKFRFEPPRDYPADIYCSGESVILLSNVERVAGILKPQVLAHVRCLRRQVVRWTVGRLQNRDGSFCYRAYRWGRIKLRSIRWGQAIMLKALASLMLCESKLQAQGSERADSATI